MKFGTVDRYTYGRVVQTERRHWCQIDVWHSEDWYDLVPPFVDVLSGDPVDFSTFTALAFHLWIRPIADYSGAAIDHLTLGSGIALDAGLGRIHFYRVRDTVDNYPIGRWHQWLGMSWTDSQFGAGTCKLLWEGPFVVHPGRFVDLRPPYLPPVNTVAPVVSGTVAVGSVLTCSTGTWTNSPTSYSYQWKRGTTNVGINANTYTLVAGDVDAMMSCVVTATNISDSASATSNSVGPVYYPVPVNTVLPTISGSIIVGSTLTATTGTWTNSPTSYAYQWKKGGVAISGATSNTYVTVSGDIGSMITVTVTATNPGGAGAPATSSGVGPIVAAGGGAALLVGETDGLGIDFTYPVDAERVAVKTASVVASQGINSFLTNTVAITGVKQVFNSSGALVWTPHNMFLNSGSPATQTVTTIVGLQYTVSVVGSGSLVGSGGASGTATAGSPLTFTATTTSSVFTKSGTLTQMQMNRGSVPTEYLPTTGAMRVGVAIDYDPNTGVCRGLCLEGSATNLILNNAVMSTQNVTVSASTYALTFMGTGTVTLSGASTAGPLVGTGAGNRVSLTFTPSAGTLTLTVSGSVTNAQLETISASAGAAATSIIPTLGASVTRPADNVSFLLSAIPALGSAYTLYVRAAPSAIANQASRYAFQLHDGTTAETAGLACSAGSQRLIVQDGGTQQCSIPNSTVTIGSPQSGAGRVAANDFAFSAAGVAASTDTAGTLPSPTTVGLGCAAGGGASTNYYIEKMAIITSRGLTNAELATKSAT